MDSLYINCILIICVTGGGSDWYHGTRILMTCALIAIFLQEFALIGFLCINELDRYRQKLAGAVLGFSFVTGDGRFFYLSFMLVFFHFKQVLYLSIHFFHFIYGFAYQYTCLPVHNKSSLAIISPICVSLYLSVKLSACLFSCPLQI